MCCGENCCDMRKLIFLCPSVCRSLRATCLFCRWSYEERLVFLMWLTAAQPRTSKTKERLMHPIIHLHCWSQIWGRAIAKTLSEKYQTLAQIALLKHKTSYDFFQIFLPCDKCQLTEADLSLSIVLSRLTRYYCSECFQSNNMQQYALLNVLSRLLRHAFFF